MVRKQSVFDTGDNDDPTVVFLPPDPCLIKGKKAGAIAEYLYMGASVNRR